MAIQSVDIPPHGATPAPSGGCACCSSKPARPQESLGDDEGEVTSRHAVAGMTCGHCVDAVTSELLGLSGVTAVEVDLVGGGTSTVSVRSTRPLADEEVASAVDEAGYRLV